ncbi:MAG: phosphohydrolase [Candidatus Magasanikbacteria bacterium RIFOXYD2_FULL_39_9]|uniref:Phosphohydrolase n=1 Tax=Candidatus Magasanikbacteria bacterium RIFOXYD1_FULL_40_23 TaxID=1798705 RepID=A0A1F6P9F5_9BACT|nr:MAG: phosphohydrolase [Candidatus Magasanikbacteria bacterium RIFOXYD1_FULL_40_23]OGH93067.1 MAG: phosphohydrolase [Candidatus Magasanikbacteria bacterium RIFOXYD2_FULL_39_9]
MEENILISKIVAEVKLKMEGEGSGHDWWHVYRVWQMAKRIGEQEKANLLIVELGALLHDIADWKFHDGDDTVGPRVAEEILAKNEASQEIIEAVSKIISEVSFKGVGVKTEPSTLEGKAVQDADRIDALGAIGIARAFAYGGHKNRVMYDPNIKPVIHTTKEEYIKSEGTTVNHFYEKLLLLKDLLNTETAKEIAQSRHKFMAEYLDRFYKEWEGTM